MTDQRQADVLIQMRDVLHDSFLALDVVRSTAEEDFAAGVCRLTASVCVKTTDEVFEVRSEGVGTVAAFFAGLRARYQGEHPSLKSLVFTHFDVRGLVDESGNGSRTDAHARATVGLTNSYGREFLFVAETASVGRSSLQAVAGGVAYFVNSERAYITMYNALAHYREAGRTDLVTKYTSMLAEMVRNTSYSEVIERMKLP